MNDTMLCLKLEDSSEDMIFSRQQLYFMGFSSICEPNYEKFLNDDFFLPLSTVTFLKSVKIKLKLVSE